MDELLNDDLLTDEPGCWLYHQGDFALQGLPANTTPGVDLAFFPFPPLDPGDPIPVSGGGSFFSIIADRPEIRTFVRYVASPRWGEEWAAPPLSGFVSPNTRFDPAAYGRDADPVVAAVQRAMGELARAAIADGSFRFDASDLMPGPIGSFDEDRLTPGEFFQGMLDVVDGARTMDQVLSDIEAAWVELEAASS